MEIILHNFRCHASLKLDLKEREIILLRGESGVGKSTVLNAIYWLLYGKVRKISPQDNESIRTSVKLITPKYSIYRQNKPRLLRVTIPGDRDYEDQVGQSLVDRMFGEHEIFQCFNYLQQRRINFLLEATAKQKISFLKKLTMTEDPGVLLNKLQQRRAELEPSKLSKETIFKHEIKILNQLLKRFNPKLITPQTIPDIKRLIDQEEQRITERTARSRFREELLEQRERIENELNRLPDTEDHSSEISCLKKDLERFQRYQEQCQLREYLNQLESEKEKLIKQRSAIVTGDLTHLKDQYRRTLSLEQQIVKFSNLCTRKGIEYHPESINTFLSKNRRLVKQLEDKQLRSRQYQRDKIERQQKLKRLQEYRDKIERQEAELERITQQLSSFTFTEQPSQDTQLKDQLIDLERQLNLKEHKIKQLKNSLQCPCCSARLRLQNGKLVSVVDNVLLEELETEVKLIKQQRKEKIDQLNDLKSELRRDRERRRHHQQLLSQQEKVKTHLALLNETVADFGSLESASELEEVIFSQPEAELLKQARRKAILEISYHEKPTITSTTLRTEINNLKLTRQVDELNDKIESLSRSIIPIEPVDRSVETRLRHLRAQQVEHIKISERKVVLTEKLADLSDRLDKIKIPRINPKRLSTLRRFLTNLEVKEEINQKKQFLRGLKDEIKEIRDEVNKINLLSELIVRAEYYSYHNIVTTVNSRLKQIIPLIFEEETSLKMELFTKLKSSNRIKPTINFIFKKGIRELQINQLSGGELERVSLALTLSLIEFSKSPLLLLDEFLSSLDDPNRKKSIKVLSLYKEDKTVLAVNHSGTEGFYHRALDI